MCKIHPFIQIWFLTMILGRWTAKMVGMSNIYGLYNEFKKFYFPKIIQTLILVHTLFFEPIEHLYISDGLYDISESHLILPELISMESYNFLNWIQNINLSYAINFRAMCKLIPFHFYPFIEYFATFQSLNWWFMSFVNNKLN